MRIYVSKHQKLNAAKICTTHTCITVSEKKKVDEKERQKEERRLLDRAQRDEALKRQFQERHNAKLLEHEARRLQDKHALVWQPPLMPPAHVSFQLMSSSIDF
jgi:hypothetical protein